MTILVFGGQNDWTITTTHEGTNVTVRARPLPGRRALHRYDAQDHTTRCLEIVPRHIVQNLTEHPVEFRQTWDLQACLNFQTLGYFIGL